MQILQEICKSNKKSYTQNVKINELLFDKVQKWVKDNGNALINETMLLGYFQEFVIVSIIGIRLVI